MSEVKRYDLELYHNNGGEMQAYEDGGFVSYEDYEALQQKLESTEALMLAMRDDSRESRSRLELITAECAALKSGAKYFSYSDFSGFEEHNTAKLAMEHADADLAGERDEASSEGWSEETSTICWGVICQKAVEDKFEKPSEANGWVGWSDFSLMPEIKTPATDAMVNEIRAEGVELLSDLAGKEYQRFAHDKAMQKKWKGIVLLCCDFANQLRSDAAKGGSDD